MNFSPANSMRTHGRMYAAEIHKASCEQAKRHLLTIVGAPDRAFIVGKSTRVSQWPEQLRTKVRAELAKR